MESAQVKTKRWGSSLGIIIPSDIIKKEQIKEGQDIEVFFLKPKKVNMDKLFGSLKNWKKPTQKLLDEVDKELWKE